MRIYLINDCFVENNLKIWHHYGSKAVIDSIKVRLVKAGHEIVHVCKKPNGPIREHIEDSDALIINGEGTFRDEDNNYEPGRHKRLKSGILLAKEMGRKVYLFNTTWCKMHPNEWRGMLSKLDGVAVREPDSADEMQRTQGIRPEIYIDEVCQLAITPNVGVDLSGQIVVGEFYPGNMKDKCDQNHPGFKGMPFISLLDHDWSYVVNSLRGVKMYIVGQHHGVYVACKARCPFVLGRVNTHKITGLFKWAGVSFPIANSYKEIQEGIKWANSHGDEYKRFFDWIERQKPWPIPV